MHHWGYLHAYAQTVASTTRTRTTKDQKNPNERPGAAPHRVKSVHSVNTTHGVHGSHGALRAPAQRGDGPKPPRKGRAILSRRNTTTFSVWPRAHNPPASTVNSPLFIRPFRAGDGSIVIGNDAKSNLAIALINNPDRRWGIVIGILVNHGAKNFIGRDRGCNHGQSRGQKQYSHFHHIPLSDFSYTCILRHVHRPCQTGSCLLVIDNNG